MIGFALSGCAPTLAAFGGTQKVLGSNPWSLAIPAGVHPPIVVDMAQGRIITTQLREAALAGQTIPEGLALDQAGNATTDPTEALLGAILAYGEHKGYAIALVLEVLAGVLTGASYSTDLPDFDAGRTTPKQIGHLFAFIAIDRFIDPDSFRSRVDDLLHRVKKSGENVRIPGERRARVAAERSRNGVPVAEPVARRLSRGRATAACS